VANNETDVALIARVRPATSGEITIALTPGPNNDNGNHFTYLGALQIDWAEAPVADAPRLAAPAFAGGAFSFSLEGTSGATYRIQRSTNLISWEDLQTVTLATTSQTVQVTSEGPFGFYRAVRQ
jgi:hypothetical protein